MQNIMRSTKASIRRERVPSLEELEEKRTNVLLESLRETLEKGEYPKQDGVIDRLLEQGHAATDIASALLHMLSAQDGRGEGRGPERPTGDLNPPPAPPAREGRAYPAYEPRSSAPRPRREDGPPPRGRAQRDFGPVSHEAGMLRLALNVGSEQEIGPGDIVGVVLGVAKIEKADLGAINVAPRETLVDIAEPKADLVLKKLNGIRFKGRKLAARIAG